MQVPPNDQGVEGLKLACRRQFNGDQPFLEGRISRPAGPSPSRVARSAAGVCNLNVLRAYSCALKPASSLVGLGTSRRLFSLAACYTDSGAEGPAMSAIPACGQRDCAAWPGGDQPATSRAAGGDQPNSPTSSSAGSGGSLVSGRAACAELAGQLKLTCTFVGS